MSDGGYSSGVMLAFIFSLVTPDILVGSGVQPPQSQASLPVNLRSVRGWRVKLYTAVQGWAGDEQV